MTARRLATVYGALVVFGSCTEDASGTSGRADASVADDEAARPTPGSGHSDTTAPDGIGDTGRTSTGSADGSNATEGTVGRTSGTDSGGRVGLCGGESNTPMEFWFDDDDWPFELDNGEELRVIDGLCDLKPLATSGHALAFEFACLDPQGQMRSVGGYFIEMDQLVAWLESSTMVRLHVVHLGDSESPTWFSMRDASSSELIGFGIQADALSLPPHTDGLSDPIGLTLLDAACDIENGYCGSFENLAVEFDVGGRILALGDDMRATFEGYDFNLVAAFEEDVITDDVPNCGSLGFRRAIGLFVTRDR